MMKDMEQQDLIIYRTEDGRANIALYARDGNVWLSQTQLAELFSTSKQNVSSHIINMLEEKGGISHKQMEEYARAEYKQFDARQKKFEAERADEQDLKELKQLEKTIKQEHDK